MVQIQVELVRLGQDQVLVTVVEPGVDLDFRPAPARQRGEDGVTHPVVAGRPAGALGHDRAVLEDLTHAGVEPHDRSADVAKRVHRDRVVGEGHAAVHRDHGTSRLVFVVQHDHAGRGVHLVLHHVQQVLHLLEANAPSREVPVVVLRHGVGEPLADLFHVFTVGPELVAPADQLLHQFIVHGQGLIHFDELQVGAEPDHLSDDVLLGIDVESRVHLLEEHRVRQLRLLVLSLVFVAHVCLSCVPCGNAFPCGTPLARHGFCGAG